MTIDTFPQGALGQPRTEAAGRFPDLWSWLRKEHGIWTDLLYGTIPLLPLLILVISPGSTLREVMAGYALLCMLAYVLVYLLGAWRRFGIRRRSPAGKGS